MHAMDRLTVTITIKRAKKGIKYLLAHKFVWYSSVVLQECDTLLYNILYGNCYKNKTKELVKKEVSNKQKSIILLFVNIVRGVDEK